MFESLASCFAFRCSASFNMTVQKKAGHRGRLPANCNHLAIGHVIVSEIVFPRLSFDHVEKKLLELFITRARPQRSHDVKLQIAAKTWAQLSIAREPQLVAVLAEMHVRHRADETYELGASRNLIVSGWTIRSKLQIGRAHV